MARRLPVRQQTSLTPAQTTNVDSIGSRNFVIAAVVLLAASFAAYLPSLNFQFILDDHRFVGDPRVQSPGHVWEYFANYVWAQFTGGPSTFYRPLFVLWMRLNFMLSEMSPWGWHLLSILKHLAVAALLGLLVWILLRDRTAALLAVGLFALHPAHTESVAWVTVPDPLMSIAVMASLFLYLKYLTGIYESGAAVEAKSKSRKSKRAAAMTKPSLMWLLASAMACLAALFAKETALVLPPVLFALAMYMTPQPTEAENTPADRTGSRTYTHSFKLRLLYALRLSLPFVIVTAFYLLMRFHALGGKLGAKTQHLSPRTVLLSSPATLWFYVKVLFWPVRLHAFADSSQTNSFSIRGVLLPGLGVICTVAALTWILFWAWTRAERELPFDAVRVRCALLLGSLLLVLPIVPALNLNALNPGDFLHGRYTYLPLAGLMLLLTTAWHLVRRERIYLLSAAGLLAVVFIVLTVRQETAWKDDLTVFTVAHELAPHNAPVARNLARAHVQAAIELDESGRCDEALPVFEAVTRQYPDDWFAWAGLGDCLVQLNDLPRAEQSLHRAADLSKNPRVIQQWQQVRARVAGSPLSSPQ